MTPVWMTIVALVVGLVVPLKVNEEGWKLQVASAGRPIQESWSVPLNPGAAARVRVSVTLPVRDTVRAVWAGVRERVRMGGEAD